MIIGCYGSQGSGKTLFLVRCAKIYSDRGKDVYSNFHLNFPHKILNFHDVVDCTLSDAIVIIDEAQLWGLDSRSAFSKTNKHITKKFLLQCRKMNVLLLFSSQRMRQIDVRCRENTCYVCWCRKLVWNGLVWIDAIQSKNYPVNIPQKIAINCINMDNAKQKKFSFVGNKYFDMYDTSEIVQMQEIEDEEKKEKKDPKDNEEKT